MNLIKIVDINPTVNRTVPRIPNFHAFTQYNPNSKVKLEGEFALSTFIGFSLQESLNVLHLMILSGF